MRDRIPGGKAAGMQPWQFDPIEISRGIRVELEHTNDWRVAREIAMDHLVEDPRYYRKLATIHLDGLRGYSAAPRWFAGLLGLVIGGWLAVRRK